METYGSGVMVAVVMVSCFVIQGYSGVVREGEANCQVPNGLENRPVEVEGGGGGGLVESRLDLVSDHPKFPRLST